MSAYATSILVLPQYSFNYQGLTPAQNTVINDLLSNMCFLLTIPNNTAQTVAGFIVFYKQIDSSYPLVFQAMAAALKEVYETLMGSPAVAPSVFANAVATLVALFYRMVAIIDTGLTNLGGFNFDGSQGSVEIKAGQSVGSALTDEFSTASTLYVWDSTQTESSFVSQSVQQYGTGLALIISGEYTGIFTGHNTYALIFPQQVLPSYGIDR